MSSIAIAGDTSGSITLQAPAIAGTNTVTLPATTGYLFVTPTSGTLNTSSGGTGLTSFTSGGAMYATSTSALTTGTLPIASGGTNNASLGVTAGGVVYTDGSALQNVGAGTAGYYLQSNGASAPTWTAVSTTPTTAQVLTATAGATAGAVGTYAMLGQTAQTATALTLGTSYAGSGFCYFGINNGANGNGFTIASSNAASFGFGSGTPSGTWLCLGTVTTTNGNYARGTLFLRTA
jgi:hypothetical protein